MGARLMGADYPEASWVPADPSNYHAAHRISFSEIVIHCTDGHENAQPVAEMWQQPGHGSSANLVVGQAGEVIQCVALRDIAWHAHAANATSIGIEHCARTPGELGKDDPGLRPSDAQYSSSAKLVAWLCRYAGLQPSRDVIKGHAEADPATTHTLCPIGCGWDWDRYMPMVQQEYDALDSAT